MLHLAPPHTAVPGNYAFPAEKLPPGTSAAAVSLPVVDMSRSRDEVRRAILDAGKEMGFFQASLVEHRPLPSHELSRSCLMIISHMGVNLRVSPHEYSTNDIGD